MLKEGGNLDKHMKKGDKKKSIVGGSFEAVKTGDLESVKTYFENNPTVSVDSREDGDTMLYLAATEGHSDIVDYLLDKGADITEPIGGSDILERAQFYEFGKGGKIFESILKKALKLKLLTFEEFYDIHFKELHEHRNKQEALKKKKEERKGAAEVVVKARGKKNTQLPLGLTENIGNYIGGKKKRSTKKSKNAAKKRRTQKRK